MKFSNIAKVSLKAVMKHKMRAFLIILAIVVGIATLTVVVCLAGGADKKIKESMDNFGSHAVSIHSGGGAFRGPSSASDAIFTKKDLADIENIDGVSFISPFQAQLDMPIKYGNKFTTSWVFGVMPNWKDAWKRGVTKGRFISDDDIEVLAKNCAVGTTVVKELFGDTNPIGKDILVGNVYFNVVGILEKKGQSPVGTDFDNLIVTPFTTASRRLMNQPLYIGNARAIIDDPSEAKRIAGEIREILRRNRKLAETEEDDFKIRTFEGVAKMVKSISKTMSIFFLLVAFISPLVGGVVLMNIMLIAVSERKREIGLRRAMGAKKKQIVFQFLVESVILTFSGGLLGALIGVGIAIWISLSGKPISISWQPFAIAFIFSTLIGLFFGIYPAKKAANVDPARALA